MIAKSAYMTFCVAALLTLAAPASADATYTLVRIKNYNTTAAGLNDAGDIVGSYGKGKHDNYSIRGFLRTNNGHESKFIVTGATVTAPAAVNDMDEVVGTHSLKGASSHGFVRNPNKDIVEFDTDENDVVLPIAINPSGTSLAVLWDGTVEKGAIRAPGGTITKFQAPKVGGERPATVPTAINTDGEAVGYATTSDQHSRGLICSPDGTITMFDARGAGSGRFQGTFPNAVNSSGTIAGVYTGADGISHEFLRTADGTVTSFDVTGGIGVTVAGLNDAGAVVGTYVVEVDGQNDSHGYIRAADGAITTFDVPNALDTVPTGINSSGQITGNAYFASGIADAFIRTP